MCYLRCFKADSAHPVGLVAVGRSFGRRRRRCRRLATSFADSLTTRLAQGASIDDAAQSGATSGAATAGRLDVMIAQSGYLLLDAGRLEGAFLSKKLQLRL